jgi:hypothetical protein
MDNKEAFQAVSLELILSAIGCKKQALGFPLKIGTPRYMKGKTPTLKFNKSTMRPNQPLVIEPEKIVDLVVLMTCPD